MPSRESTPSPFGRDVLRTLGTQGALIAVGIATSVLTARALGPEARGGYSLCALLVALAVWFGSFELAPSQVQHVGRRREDPGRVLGGVLPLVAALGAVTWLALRLAEPLLAAAFPTLPRDAFAWATLAVPLEIAAVALNQFLRALGRIDDFNRSRAAGPVLQLGALAVAFALGGGLVEAFVAWVAADAVWLAGMAGAVARRVRPDFGEARRLATSLLRTGARLQAASAIAALELRVGGLLVAAWLSAPELAFFAIADGLAKRLLNLPTAVGTVLMPRIAREGEARSAELAAATCRSTLLLVAVTLVAAAVLAWPAVDLLYGDAYHAVVAPLWLLLPYPLGQAAVRTLSPHLVLGGRVGWLASLNALGLAAHLLLLWALIPRYGVLGAAAAGSASRVLLLFATAAVFARVTGIPVARQLRADAADLGRLRGALRSALGR